MLEDIASEGHLDKTWQLGFPPTASLHNCLSWRPSSTWLALQCDAAMLVVLDIGNSSDEMPSEVSSLQIGFRDLLNIIQIQCHAALGKKLLLAVSHFPSLPCHPTHKSGECLSGPAPGLEQGRGLDGSGLDR